MELLDGKKLSAEIKEELSLEVEKMVKDGLKRPHLTAVLVGEDPASHVYVRNKMKLCESAGFKSSEIIKDREVTEEELLDIVHQLNEDDDVDGFIVQLPLPKHIDEQKVNLAIDPRKDVDGFHPMNMGRMTLGLPAYLPATPQGIITMLDRYDIETHSKHVGVLGRSNIVGMPISILLASDRHRGDATVTLMHSESRNQAEVLPTADIIISAVGKPNLVTADLVKEGAVVIDVGINRIKDKSRKRGYRLVGDVDFENVAPKCSYITPVPGGVGRMTVISLLMNTMKAAKKEIYG